MVRFPTPWFRRGRGWYVTVNGKQIGLDLTDEVVRAGELQAAVERVVRQMGLAPLPAEVADPDAVVVRAGPVGELVEQYRAVVLNRLTSADSRAGYGRVLDWLAGEFGGEDVRAVAAAEVAGRARSAGWSDSTLRYRLVVASGFFRWCGRVKFKPPLPPLVHRGVEAVISPEEFRALLGEASGDYGPVLRFMHLTGVRPGEARTLAVEMVDWVNGVAEWKKHKTSHKGHRRQVPLGDESMALLSAQRERYKTGLLFRNRNGDMFTSTALRMRMWRIRKRAGLRSDVMTYGLRHTFVTEMLEDGHSVADVAALAGHSSPTMVEKCYSHVAAGTKRLKQVASRRKSGSD